MKLTAKKLKEIIKEEMSNMIEDVVYEAEGEEVMQAISDVPKAAEQIATKVRAEIESLAEPSGLDPLVLSPIGTTRHCTTWETALEGETVRPRSVGYTPAPVWPEPPQPE